jgi:hypothetical protein
MATRDDSTWRASWAVRLRGPELEHVILQLTAAEGYTDTDQELNQAALDKFVAAFDKLEDKWPDWREREAADDEGAG